MCKWNFRHLNNTTWRPGHEPRSKTSVHSTSLQVKKAKSNAAALTRAKKQTSHQRGLFEKSGKRLERSTTRCEWSLKDVGFSMVRWASAAPRKTLGNMRSSDPVKTNFSTACQCWEKERYPHHQCQENQLRWASRPKQLRKHTLAMTTKGFKYEVPWDAHTKSLAEVVSDTWRDRAFNSIVWWSPYGKHLGFMGILQLIIYKHWQAWKILKHSGCSVGTELLARAVTEIHLVV